MNTKIKPKIQNTLKNKLQQIKPQKIGAVITVLLFGLICAIGGYELNSATSGASSVLPIAKGGTGSNNAANARTNLEVSSTTEMNTAINYPTGWKANSPYIWKSQTYTLYSKILAYTYRNSYNASYNFSLYLLNGNTENVSGTVYLAIFKNISETIPYITGARWCPTLFSTTNTTKIEFAIVNTDGIYSIWIRDNRNVANHAFYASGKAQLIGASGPIIQSDDVLLTNTSESEPDGVTDKGWTPLTISCGTPAPSP
ncbi:MAG: hypothetical protein LBB10_02175 [Bifidobacteriaceae bacterium]|jgi:hypothetical protein|nr:hypothetical protein [Bifidobacteriaceae bacterium]